jgi:FtsP/CotA-like multicopper oxidase with cupredoxin domain
MFSPSLENIDQVVDGGESKTYTFEIPEDAQSGLVWYHNHVHGVSWLVNLLRKHVYSLSMKLTLILSAATNDVHLKDVCVFVSCFLVWIHGN